MGKAVTEVLQTKLDKSKAFMDTESFVFLFKESKPFAIHKDQLFKNQLYNETIDEYGHKKYTRKNDSVIKREKLEDIKIYNYDVTNFAQNGDKFDGAENVTVPVIKLNTGNLILTDYKYSKCVRISPKDITINEETFKDSIKDYCFFENNLYILTINGVFSKVEVSNYEAETPNVSITDVTGLNIGTIVRMWEGYYIKSGIYLLNKDGELYHYYKQDEAYTTVKVGDNFHRIKTIRSYNQRTFVVMKDGRCFAVGNNSNGALAIGSKDITITTLTEVCSQVVGRNVEEKFLLRNFEVEDVGIGKYHTILLLKDGTAIGFGGNKYAQLDQDTEKVFDTTYKFFKYNNKEFKEVKCTPYGTIFNTYDGSFVYLGVFLSGELGIYTENDPIYMINNGVVDKTQIVEPAKVLTIDDKEYTKFLKSEYLTKFIDKTKIKRDFIVKLFNTYNENIWYIGEDMQLYCSGKIYDKFGVSGEDSNPNADTMTALPDTIFGPLRFNEIEAHSKPIIIPPTKIVDKFRNKENRQEYWSYYKDVVSKLDNARGGITAIFFKTKNKKWIDWTSYLSKYMYVNLTDKESKVLPKIESVLSVDDVKLDTHLSYDSFAKYLELNPSIETEFVVPNKNIPEVDYIDNELKVWKINAGDNLATQLYTEAIYNEETKSLQERRDIYQTRLKNYEDAIKLTEDVEEIAELSDSRDRVQKEINKIDEELETYKAKIGSVYEKPYLDFAELNIVNPLKVVGKINKNVNYTRTVFEEPDPITGEGKVKETVLDGKRSIVKETESKSIQENKLRIGFDFVDLDYIKDPMNTQDSINKRDDIKLSLNDDPDYPEDKTTFREILPWLSGRFINKDHFIGNDFKAFCIKDGKSLLNTRRICEFPTLGEPHKYAKNQIPTINIDTATVTEPTYPTELRWDINLRAFSWNNIRVDGPYKIHNADVSSELTGLETFYFGDVYVQIFTKIRLMYRRCEKNTFILFLDGAVVPDSEYDVTYNPETDISTIHLHTYSKYVLSTLQEQIDVNDPGYEGHVRQMVESLNEGKQFSIAFLNTEEKYKKVKIYYDRENIRNYPRPGSVMFRNVSYNDLLIVDGFYIPYLWDSKNVVKFPDYIYSSRDSNNDFIVHSDIYILKPYISYKREDELVDSEIKSYILENELMTSSEVAETSMSKLREKVKLHLNKRVKEY